MAATSERQTENRQKLHLTILIEMDTLWMDTS
jgi:hypothetical protein